MTTEFPQRVHRRRVFYIPGYDPFHPRRYREIYRKEGGAQAAISGYALALAPKRGGGPYGWRVMSSQDGASVQTEVEVLVWSDIVRASMGASVAQTYGQMLRTAWVYAGSGALWRLMRLRKGPVLTALYPVAMLLLQALLAAILAVFAAVQLAALLRLLSLPQPLAMALAWVSGAAILWLVLRWFRSRDRFFYAYYLMHDFAFSAGWRGANPPALEARMAQFRDTLARAITEDWDEVLVVGHSSGAQLAVSILADLARADQLNAPRQNAPGAEAGQRVALLTLGQVIPMMSFLPEAHRLRGDLRDLSRCPALFWLDVTAPGDGCAFALCDPVAVSGVAPNDQIWPRVISAAFTRSLSPARWKALRWRFVRLHFQYISAFDQPLDYDYFRITAGPLRLAQRYRARASSRSAKRTALNPHTSCLPLEAALR